jgi:glutamyl/glutaminyl-tRNA synthetase
VGDYFLALRVAVTGVTKTPPFWDVIEILGMEETLDRIKKLIKKIR